MKQIISFILIGSLLSVGTLFAQSPSYQAKKKVGINLSLWKGVATQSIDSTSNTTLNIGLLSAMNQLNGMSLNAIGGVCLQQANGIQAAGIFNLNKGNTNGIQIAGITNINGQNANGISLSGLVNITSNYAQGISITGLTNIVGNDAKGLTIGGLMNFIGQEAKGISVAGIANIAGESSRGIALAGLINISGEQTKGLQVAGLGNITNILNGAQVGLANVAVRGKGLQIGLVNYYNESFDGWQLGLVNANPNTHIQPMLSINNNASVNVGIRFKNPKTYTILGFGMPYLGFDKPFAASAFYRAGMEFPLLDDCLFISGDMGFQHIESFKNKHHGYPKRYYALQPRLSIDYHLSEQFSLFVTGGYSWDKPYKWGHCIDKGLLIEVGTTILKM